MKKPIAEECMQLSIKFIVLISPKGYYIKYSSTDKNFDPDWHKVPEIADVKKSYNIASNKYF